MRVYQPGILSNTCQKKINKKKPVQLIEPAFFAGYLRDTGLQEADFSPERQVFDNVAFKTIKKCENLKKI